MPDSGWSHTIATFRKTIKNMKLFTGLKKLRALERTQLPFLTSLLDFDIVIEIGAAEEDDHPLTLKQLFLANVGSRSTVRRRLERLIEEGIVSRRKNARDQRSAVLTIASSSRKLFAKYCTALVSIVALNFK